MSEPSKVTVEVTKAGSVIAVTDADGNVLARQEMRRDSQGSARSVGKASVFDVPMGPWPRLYGEVDAVDTLGLMMALGDYDDE